ncbi:MAG: ABC transporter permease [Dyella sp.]
MSLHPILAALRKHKAGVVLIALQIALTLAIVCNAVFIIGQRIERINRPSGLDEQNLFLVSQQWVGAPSADDPAGAQKLDVMMREDLAALRSLPNVVSVVPINSLPLLNSSWTGALSLKPGTGYDESNGSARSSYYFVDDQAVATLGLRLVAGRNFTAGEINHHGVRDQFVAPVVMVTKAIADKLYPQGAVGKVVYVDGTSTPSTIVGVVERMQVPSVSIWADGFVWNSTLQPVRLGASFSRYAVRAKPGQLEAAMRAVPAALYRVDPMRVLDDDSVFSFAQIRQNAYRSDRGMAILMGVVCVILVAVTAAGIVGLTTFWVGQRQRQIGVRRALGARKIDILRYFQIENLMIAGIGAVLGIALAISLNLWLISRYEMARLPVPYVLLAVLVVMALGQAAVYVPARRASAIAPVVATRAA